MTQIGHGKQSGLVRGEAARPPRKRPGDRVAPKAVGGLDIRFASRGVIADDEIVGLVETAQEPVVVVTSDRELQQRTRAGAQIVLDGRALAAYASGSTGR